MAVIVTTDETLILIRQFTVAVIIILVLHHHLASNALTLAGILTITTSLSKGLLHVSLTLPPKHTAIFSRTQEEHSLDAKKINLTEKISEESEETLL